MASTGNEDSRSLRTRLDFTDAELLAECEVHTYRASGPGGQKRNKTSSAVRLHHQPSGLRAPAEESRSQHENKARALRRLRETIAVSCRLDPPTSKALPPELVSPDLVLRVSAKNPQRVNILAQVLDWLAYHEGDTAAAGQSLGVSASSLTRFLAETPKAWAAANAIREQHGRRPLRT